MNDIRSNIIERALLKNKKICLPEQSDSRVKIASKKLKKMGFNIIYLEKITFVYDHLQKFFHIQVKIKYLQ